MPSASASASASVSARGKNIAKKISQKSKSKPKPKPRPQSKSKHASEIELKPQHSFDLMRTAIAAIIFQVIHFRQAFRSAKWVKRTFDPTDPDTSYDAFLAGTNDKNTPNGFFWMVPVPGEDLQVDKLLSRLEIGVSDALAKKHLRKVQLSFHRPGIDAISNENALELCAMTVTYGSDDAYLSTEIRNSQGSELAQVHVLDGKNQLKDMIDGVKDYLVANKKSPALPAGSRVSMQLDYTDDTPEDYEPEAFHPGDYGTKRLLEMSNISTDLLTMNTGFHTIAYSFILPGLRDIQVAQCIEESPITGPEASRACSNQAPQRNVRPNHRSSSVISGSDGGYTQSQNLMMLQQAGSSRVPLASSQDTQPYFTQSVSGPQGNVSARAETATGQIVAPLYTQDVYEQLEHCVRGMSTQRDDDLDDSPRTVISCECHADVAKGSLIECPGCKRFQHAVCYGYLQNIPEFHFCYNCIKARFPQVIIDMDQVSEECLIRRALGFFLDREPLSATVDELKIHLGHGTENTTATLRNLGSKGYIQPISTKGKKKKGPPTYKYVGDYDTICREYFEPRKGLHLLFQQPDVDISDSEATACHFSADEDAPHGYGMALRSAGPTPPASSNNLPAVRGLTGSIHIASSLSDATTQEDSNIGSLANSGIRRARAPSGSCCLRGQSTPKSPGQGSTTQGTPSPQPSRNKRAASLISQSRPGKRHRSSQMSPMVVNSYGP